MIVAVAFVVSFLSFGMFTYVRGIYLPQLAEVFGTGRYEVTLGFTVEAIVAGLAAPFIGRRLDSDSPRRLLLFGLTLVTLGYVLLSRVQAVWQFYTIMATCFGIGMTCLGAFTVQRVTVSWFDRRRGLALALVILGASTSGMVMPGVCVWLIETFGWRSSLVMLAVLIAGTIYPLGILLLRDTPASVGLQVDGVDEAKAAHPAEREPNMTASEVVRIAAFWHIALVFGVFMCAFAAVTIHAFGHITDVGLSDYQAASGLFAMTLGAALGKPIVGLFTDRYGARLGIWLSLIGLATGLVLLSTAASLTSVVVAMACFGLGYSGMLPLRSYSIARAVGQANYGIANGMLNMCVLPLGLAVSPIAAFIYDVTGSYATAFQLIVVLVALAGINTFYIRPARAEGV